jgi:hypothetical protein
VALGIGVNTAIFSLVDQLLLWSIPARDPSRLVSVSGGRISSYPFFREYRERNQVFSSLFASSYHRAAGLRPEGAPAVEVGHVHYVSGDYFQALGIGAAAGRVIGLRMIGNRGARRSRSSLMLTGSGALRATST